MDVDCSICLEPFSFQNDLSTTHCGHVFHTKCITDWFQHQGKNCPQCWNNQKKHQRGTNGPKIIELFFSKNGDKIQCDKYKLVVKTHKLEKELKSCEAKTKELKNELESCKTKAQKLQESLAEKTQKTLKEQTNESNRFNFQSNLSCSDVIEDKYVA